MKGGPEGGGLGEDHRRRSRVWNLFPGVSLGPFPSGDHQPRAKMKKGKSSVLTTAETSA